MFRTRNNTKRSSHVFGGLESLETRKLMFAANALDVPVEPANFPDENMPGVAEWPGPEVDIADPILDFGDAPDRYQTRIANGGARHRVNPDVRLGNVIDAEWDGRPTRLANGDDRAKGLVGDDEDGVRFLNDLVRGGIGQVEVSVSSHGYLNGFIDFDRNGNWDSAVDQVFSGLPLTPGTHVLQFQVPANAQASHLHPTYARFRFSSTHQQLGSGHDPDEGTPDGEVEDYTVRISEGDKGEGEGDGGSSTGGGGIPTLPNDREPRRPDHAADPNDDVGQPVAVDVSPPVVVSASPLGYYLTKTMITSYGDANSELLVGVHDEVANNETLNVGQDSALRRRP